jgi:uncharacterized protein YhfF
VKAVRFAFPGPDRDRLVDAVLRGEKTATSSLFAQWEADGEELPDPGERRPVLDSNDDPVATVEFTSVDVIRLGDADLDLVREEGEGFKSVTEWRREHEHFWRGQVIPRLSGPLAIELTDETRIVVERFRLVDQLPGEPGGRR